MNQQIENTIKLYKRLLISYNDFQQAFDVGSYILEKKLHEEYPKNYRILLQALNCTMIIAYCRPFSGNDKRSKIKIYDLPNRFLNLLSKEEKEMHAVAINERNKILAHSDSDVWEINPQVEKIGESLVLVPYHTVIGEPLSLETMKMLLSMSTKLMDDVLREKMELEPKLLQYFSIV